MRTGASLADTLATPAGGDRPRTETQLRRSFVVLHLVGPLLGLIIPGLLAGVDSTPDGVVPVLVVGICLFALIPLLLRFSPRLDEPALASVQLLVFLSLFGCYHYGGLASPFTVWLIVAVLLSFLYAPRLLAWCIAGGGVQIGAFLAIYEMIPPPGRIDGGQLGVVTAASVLAAALYISLIGAFYARVKREGSALADAARGQQDDVARLQTIVRQAENDNSALSDFMASMSHELRTSLNVVIGYSEMLAEDAAVEERSDAEGTLRRITRSSRALLGMVDEVASAVDRPAADVPAAPLADTSEPVVRKRAAAPLRLPRPTLPDPLRLFRRSAAMTGVPSRDSLTGLLSRAAFQAELDRGIAGHAGRGVAILTADLNGFKEVNDTLGHDAGDQLLRTAAERFAAAAPKSLLLARLGGDEFGAAAFGDGAEAAMLDLAEAMADTLSAPIRVGEDYLTVGVSIGVASGIAGSIGWKELLRRGDVAMHRARQDPREPIQAFIPQMDEALRFKRTIRQDLVAALANDQFDLLLQPVVSARSGELTSAEALLRWPHPVLGFVSPAKLIPLAEETGQIIAIDDWVLERALTYAARLGTLPIAVNVSPIQFRHPGFVRKVVDRLAAHNVSPGLIRLEITEGVLVTHTKAAARAVAELREAGIKIALDDFGTGFSSLSYLKDLPFDLIKVDRSFITALDEGQQGTALLRAIVELGHSLGMGVVAEGVETASQASVLQLLGCDFIQGYFTGRPASIDAIETRLRSSSGSHHAAGLG